MSLPYFVKQLDNDEHLQAVIYRSAWMYLPSFVISLGLIWTSLFFSFYLESHYGSNGVMLMLFAIMVGFFILARRIMILKYTAWVITNKRLIDFSQKGFLKADINEEYLKDLYRPYMAVTKLWERFCGCSTVRIMLMHEKAFLEISGIAKSKLVVDFLKNIVPNYNNEKKQLKNLHDDLGKDEFEILLDEMVEEEKNK